jgi:hypothetical protein
MLKVVFGARESPPEGFIEVSGVEPSEAEKIYTAITVLLDSSPSDSTGGLYVRLIFGWLTTNYWKTSWQLILHSCGVDLHQIDHRVPQEDLIETPITRTSRYQRILDKCSDTEGPMDDPII